MKLRREAFCPFQKIYSVLENCHACPELVGVIGVRSSLTCVVICTVVSS